MSPKLFKHSSTKVIRPSHPRKCSSYFFLRFESFISEETRRLVQIDLIHPSRLSNFYTVILNEDAIGNNLSFKFSKSNFTIFFVYIPCRIPATMSWPALLARRWTTMCTHTDAHVQTACFRLIGMGTLVKGWPKSLSPLLPIDEPGYQLLDHCKYLSYSLNHGKPRNEKLCLTILYYYEINDSRVIAIFVIVICQ